MKSSGSTPAVSVVVPTYNERENVAELAGRVFSVLDPVASELLIVDDDSPDGTAAAVEKLAETWPVRVLVRRGERGLARAVICGLRAARGGLLVSLDADLSHPPEMIPRLLAALEDPSVQMAIGSRFVQRLAGVKDSSAGRELLAELADRYGPVPEALELLLKFSLVKNTAERIGIESVERRAGTLHVKFHPESRVRPENLMQLVAAHNNAQFTPDGVLRLPLAGVAGAAALLGFVERQMAALDGR